MPNDEVEKLILDNIKLVPYFAKRFKKSLNRVCFCHDWNDIMQEGMLALTLAAHRFNPSLHNTFSTYAGSYICGYIKNMISHRSFFLMIKDEDLYKIRFNDTILKDIDDYDISYNPEDYINNNIDNKTYIHFVKKNTDARKFNIIYKTIALDEIDQVPADKYGVTRSRIGQIKKSIIKHLKPKMISKFGVYNEYTD